MSSPYDVPASKLIEKVAMYLKANVYEITPPAWANIVKSGAHVQRPPQNPDWWYVRCASLLRKILAHGPVGVEKLRAKYGGRKDFGVKPEHTVKAGGKIIREALHQLQAAGFIETIPSRGRRITREGRKLLKELTEDLHKELVKELPALAKYYKGE